MKIAVLLMILALGSEGCELDSAKYKNNLWTFAVDVIKDYFHKKAENTKQNETNNVDENEKEQFNNEWENFKLKYHKHYLSKNEEEMRKKNFKDNLEIINSHNKHSSSSFEMGINSLADFTKEELRGMNCLELSAQDFEEALKNDNMEKPVMDDSDLPENVDWRQKGAVTKVKYQGSCGSCWAFGSVGVMEGCHQIKTGELVDLSAQNIIDCWKFGCGGGNGVNGFKLAMKNHGIATEKAYPYEMRTGKCRFNSSKVGAIVKSFAQVRGNEAGMKRAVAIFGPVLATVHANVPSFVYYRRGIYNDTKCIKTVDHSVVVVGYGKTEEGVEYWILKNSWGSSWGEGGYMRLGRNMGNLCKVASYSHFITC